MGQLEQFAKQMFDEETAVVTHGAVDWQAPPEIGLAEVRIKAERFPTPTYAWAAEFAASHEASIQYPG